MFVTFIVRWLVKFELYRDTRAYILDLASMNFLNQIQRFNLVSGTSRSYWGNICLEIFLSTLKMPFLSTIWILPEFRPIPNFSTIFAGKGGRIQIVPKNSILKKCLFEMLEIFLGVFCNSNMLFVSYYKVFKKYFSINSYIYSTVDGEILLEYPVYLHTYQIMRSRTSLV